MVLADLFGTEMIAQSFGMWLFACGLAGSISSPIGGKQMRVYDLVGTIFSPIGNKQMRVKGLAGSISSLTVDRHACKGAYWS